MRIWLFVSALGSLIALTITGVHAEEERDPYSVEEVLTACKVELHEYYLRNNLTHAGLCVGMIVSAQYIMLTNCTVMRKESQSPRLVAGDGFPSAVTSMRAFVDWATKNPQAADIPAPLAMAEVFLREYPCQE